MARLLPLTGALLAAMMACWPPASAQEVKIDRAQAAADLLARVVAEVQADRAKALARLIAGTGGLRGDRMSPFCAGADGKLVAHGDRTKLGQDITKFVDRYGRPYGKEIMDSAVEWRTTEIDYVLVWRPKCGPPRKVKGRVVPTGCLGIRVSVPTRGLVTKVGDLVCGVEFSRQIARPRP
jgi:hypothetical protein